MALYYISSSMVCPDRLFLHEITLVGLKSSGEGRRQPDFREVKEVSRKTIRLTREKKGSLVFF